MSSNPDFVIENGVLSKYKGPGGDVTIPEGITVIGDDSFRDCKNLTSVTIPESVTEIGVGAFYNCMGLQSVNIPASVTKIGGLAFSDCTGLQSVNIAEGVAAYLWKAFSYTPWYKNLGEFVIVRHILVKYQGDGGDVHIPEGITEIGEYAFSGCTVPQNVTIPAGVTEIGSHAFRGCKGLQSVRIPESVKEIGDWAFEGCTGLTSITIPIPERVKAIGYRAFVDCAGLQSVTILAGVTKSESIPAGLKEIEKQVFRDCRPVLIAPHISVSNFDTPYKTGACVGFAKRYLEKAELDEEIKAGYLKYIKGQKKRFYPLAIQHEELLQLMFAEKMLVRKDIDPLLEECDKQNNVAAKAAILDYAGKNLKPVDPVKEMDREFAAMERAIERSAKNQEEF